MNTPQSWSDIGFEVEITEDGSPSLRQLSERTDATPGESMHHSGGAAAETELIYGRPIAECFQHISAPHFISVGLGLGYVEFVIAREALLAKSFEVSLESWESVQGLKDFLLAWLNNEPQPQEIKKVYDEVARFVLNGQPISIPELKAFLLQRLQAQSWTLQGALASEAQITRKAHGILFDAFSAKTTPELWTEEFLIRFFQQALQADSFFSTYASRTSLKKALKECSILFVVREGFKGKRNSTLAFQGRLETIFAPAGIS